MATPSLRLSLQFARSPEMAPHRAALPRAQVLRWLRAALGADVRLAEIAVRVVGADEGRQLNRDYRGKDYATNVLTFDYSGAPGHAAGPALRPPAGARRPARPGLGPRNQRTGGRSHGSARNRHPGGAGRARPLRALTPVAAGETLSIAAVVAQKKD